MATDNPVVPVMDWTEDASYKKDMWNGRRK